MTTKERQLAIAWLFSMGMAICNLVHCFYPSDFSIFERLVLVILSLGACAVVAGLMAIALSLPDKS